MAKGFTITPGLENMGAMKTGGQGSVYQGRRIGEIITAIKLLPTPIYAESEDDRSFRDFQNEVQKLKKVNEEANPNVVKILSSGLSETGNFPFIEMEFVEGPDLQELLKLPHDPVFTIKEVVKVAEQLACAIAHCHRKEVKHGDIKSNNVKFNIHSGNYVLLDFGLAVMSDEDRRTSLRYAGAVEFMAPEQIDGQLFFQTDVYSYGVVLFELLAGAVPFPLNQKGVTARNNVKLAHIDTAPPDVIELRKQNIPATWDFERAEKEKFVPKWITEMIYKCLEKKPENRFANGMELYDFIQINRTYSKIKDEQGHVHVIKGNDVSFEKEKERLQEELQKYKQEIAIAEREIAELQQLEAKQSNIEEPLPAKHFNENGQVVSFNYFIVLVVLFVGLAVFSAFTLFKNSNKTEDSMIIGSIAADSASVVDSTKRESIPETNTAQKQAKQIRAKIENPGVETNKSIGKFKVKSIAHFYNKPDESTRRNAFINHWNNALLSPTVEENGFIYIVYTNDKGQVSKGWLRKKDLRVVGK